MRRILISWLRTGKLLSLLLFLTTTGGLTYMMISPRFTVQHVRVEGNTLLSAEDIIALAGLEAMPIWFIDSQQVMQRMQQNPYIEHVQVTMTLPDDLALRVTERRPDVYWKIGPVNYLVDGTGRVLELTSEPPGPEVLVIRDTTPHVLQPHDQVDPDALTLAHILSLRLPEELGLAPSALGWDYGLGMYIETDGGQTIVFGQSNNLDRKLTILHELLETSTPFTYLDLRPSNPFYQNHQPPGSPEETGDEGNNPPVSRTQPQPEQPMSETDQDRPAPCAALFSVKMMGRICNPLSLA
ncbi:MAG: FtsQ-type POTRA domain-containing protein [Chloroflexaceae bacterium]|nr:FtsQ-type POTRA domain-containing protein [Chloroflexaceae bacterium]